MRFPFHTALRFLLLSGGRNSTGCPDPYERRTKKASMLQKCRTVVTLRPFSGFNGLCSKLLEAAFGPPRPFSNAARHPPKVCIKKVIAFAYGRRQCLSTCVRVRISCVDVGVNMYVCICACACACAHMHASQYGSQISKSHQFDPQMWGGPYPSLKMVSVWSSLCSFSVRNRTGRKTEV